MITYKNKPDTAKAVEKILNPTVKKWFFSRFKSFSLPQLHGVMEIHSRKNILVSAPTGATKTLTGFLSILNELVDSAEKGILEDKIYCVYISPLKALNYDIEKNLKEPLAEIEKIAGKPLGIRVGVRTGDTTQKEKADMLKNPPHILITTPESLAILLTSIKFSNHLKNVEWTIIDEIHALAESKRGVHLSLSLERLSSLATHMTRIGLSATVSPLEEVAKFLVGYKKVGGIGQEQKNAMWEANDCTIVDVQFIKDLDLKVLSPMKDLIDTTHEKSQTALYKLIDELVQKHKTTLVFTNTRAATERMVDNLKHTYPKHYNDQNIGAHHGSLSKESRFDVEEKLRNGDMKCIVCSTSLELGIDIGYIDLVILLGSPKSVARALQRVGRSGHQLHQTTKGRIIVLDRDDLIECSVLLKSAVEKKIDKMHIPTNCLDVLAQQIYGMAIQERIHINDLYTLIRQSYCYNKLSREDFQEVIDYLAGKFASLEDRHVYAKIWYDEETGMIGKRGRLARVIYMTNIGTIPSEGFITVKQGERVIGKIDEGFLERLKPGDIFVLGGNTYQFRFARGMVAQVLYSESRPPTVPQWYSDMLPLSFDLAIEIGKFRKLVGQMLCAGRTKKEIIEFIHNYLYVDDNAANACYEYIKQQFDYAEVPSNTRIILENYYDGKKRYAVFHSLFGRRVNDVLSRAVAFAIMRTQHIDVEIGINDNGFYVASEKKINARKAFNLLKAEELEHVLDQALDKTEVLKRRFRHCAGRSLMILRNYKGRTKNVGRQQVSSMILMAAVKRINPNFSILKEARREVLEDLMDLDNAKLIIEKINNDEIKVDEIQTLLPSPFAFKLIIQGITDILKMDDKIEFLKRMHDMVRLKIALDEKRKNEKNTKI